MKKSLKITALSFCILLLVYWILGQYTVRTFKLKFSPSTASEKSRMAKIVKNIDELSQGVSKGTVSWRKIDRSSIGFPETEARLLMLRSEVDFFIATFGHQPSDIAELGRLSELPDYRSERGRSLQNLRRDCEIVNLEPDSYILSCDTFSSLSAAEKKELLKSFDRETERFYQARSHIILYVPPPKLGKPPGQAEPAAQH